MSWSEWGAWWRNSLEELSKRNLWTQKATHWDESSISRRMQELEIVKEKMVEMLQQQRIQLSEQNEKIKRLCNMICSAERTQARKLCSDWLGAQAFLCLRHLWHLQPLSNQWNQGHGTKTQDKGGKKFSANSASGKKVKGIPAESSLFVG